MPNIVWIDEIVQEKTIGIPRTKNAQNAIDIVAKQVLTAASIQLQKGKNHISHGKPPLPRYEPGEENSPDCNCFANIVKHPAKITCFFFKNFSRIGSLESPSL